MLRHLTRRNFLVSSVLSIIAAACSDSSPLDPDAPRRVALFQGDSITDAGRDRIITRANSPRALGNGYAEIAASGVLRTTRDVDWRFYNRGVGGNRLSDLQARWSRDTLALRPDLLSVLIGVNDIWRTRTGRPADLLESFEQQYTDLLASTREALPETRLVVMEPYVLRCGMVDASWFPDLDEMRAATARVAARTGAVFVPLQDALDEAASGTGPTQWTSDGIHPTDAGHRLIAERWRAAVGI